MGFCGTDTKSSPVYQYQIPRTVRIRMITTRPDSRDEDDITMKSADGEVYRSILDKIKILLKLKLPPGLAPPDYKTQDEWYEHTEIYEDYHPKGTPGLVFKSLSGCFTT